MGAPAVSASGAVLLRSLAMDLASAFRTLGLSLLLGLLVGTQRERVHAPLAGVRTFALITVLGTVAGLLALRLGPWVVVAGLIGVTLVTAMGNVIYLKQSRADTGITTEIVILLMYALGAYLVFGEAQVGVVLGGTIAVLLHAKPWFQGFVKRLGETDMRVMMQFVLIALVILPLLPNQAYGPFEVLNPREIWWMVVLVVGISLAGYVALKLYGERAGIVLGGLIGGLISSTATTVSQARRTARSEARIAAGVLVVLLASTVVYARVLFEIAAVATSRVSVMAPPIAVMLAISIALCTICWWRTQQGPVELPAHANPTELKSALVFGALYALVLIAVAATRQWFGDRGIFVAAAISGLTDMDAITLTTSRMSAAGHLSPETAWRAIVLAAVCNLLFKGIVVTALGAFDLARRLAVWFGIQIAAGIAVLALWPR
jgi:uncharacterized membrane protein (DUF4010 family)